MDYNTQLTLLAEYIDQYKHVESISIGNLSFCAKQLKYSLFSHNKYIGDATDREEIKCLTQCVTKDYLIIIFSVSGALDTYGQLVKAASQKKAKVVLITMNRRIVIRNHFFLISLWIMLILKMKIY